MRAAFTALIGTNEVRSSGSQLIDYHLAPRFHDTRWIREGFSSLECTMSFLPAIYIRYWQQHSFVLLI